MAQAQAALPAINQLKDIPALRQLALLAGVAAAVAIGIAGFRWSQEPSYVPVYANLADKDAAELAEALQAAAMPYKLDTRTGAITVPEAQVHEARLKLASQGLPRGTSQGFEMMQQEQGFGTSQFIENARYQHALETELARTIGKLQPVRNARVHLAIPKPSAFARKSDTPSASVFVELHNGRSLEKVQVASIVHMVASSITGMAPSSVTVIDQFGRLLSEDGADSALERSAEQLDYAKRLESDYVRRIEQLLAPMMGQGRVSAQVTADLDFAETEEARETYTPDSAQLRSEQVSEDKVRGADPGKAAGVPGATSNQPPADTANPPLNTLQGGAAAGADPALQTQSMQATRNYELDRTISHTRQPVGRVRRLSVAVLVDNIPKAQVDGKKTTMVPTALTAEELTKVEALVKEAVGFNATRGDSVAVQNAAFFQPEALPEESVPFWQDPQLRDYARQFLGAGLVLALIFFVLRPALRNLMSASVRPQTPEALSATLVDEERALGSDRVSVGKGGAAAAGVPQLGYENQLEVARKAIAEDPKRVAQVVKSWIGQEA
ncbi:MAG TPA: flagellar basal-body MS-ring/collar protein FliF [Solimonas sp.]|nr:flagellar basal-body MS-ring/collar protein FliF [Solimonas sp.]